MPVEERPRGRKPPPQIQTSTRRGHASSRPRYRSSTSYAAARRGELWGRGPPFGDSHFPPNDYRWATHRGEGRLVARRSCATGMSSASKTARRSRRSTVLAGPSTDDLRPLHIGDRCRLGAGTGDLRHPPSPVARRRSCSRGWHPRSRRRWCCDLRGERPAGRPARPPMWRWTRRRPQARCGRRPRARRARGPRGIRSWPGDRGTR